MKKYFLLLFILFIQINLAKAEEKKEHFVEIGTDYLVQAESNLNKDSALFYAYLDSALLISEAYGLTDLKSRILINKGVYHYNKGKYAKAILIYIEALEVIKGENNFAMEAQIYDNIGLVNYAMQNYEKAIKNSLIALGHNMQIKDSTNLIRNHNNLGINYYMLKDFENAIQHYQTSNEISESLGDTRGVITALSNLGLVKAEQGDLKGAQEDYLKALEFSRIFKDPLTTAYVLINVGSNYTLLEQPDKGIETLKEAQVLGNENNFLEIKKYSHLYLGDAYAKKGDFEQSFEERRLYDALKDSILTIETEIEVTEIETKYDSQKKQDKIESQDTIIVSYSRKNTFLFILLFITVIVFSFFSYRYLKNQKRFKAEKNYIDRQYREIEHKNQELKYSLLQISNKLESDRNSESKLIKYKKSSLTSSQREAYVNKILNYMQEKKPYLNTEITQQEMATDLAINKHHLSEVLNINFGKNFYSFINLYRVERAKEILTNDTENLTMLAVAFDAGFNSKSSFNRAFKEITDITPSKFKEMQRELV